MTSPLRGRLSPGCVTGVGSLPFLDADQAVEFVAQHCPELPFWPQLPRRAVGEGVIGQGMGSLINYLEPSARPYCWAVRRGSIAAFEAAIEDGDAGLSPETAAGFFVLERAIASGRFPAARAVKAQIEGPATLSRCLFLDDAPVALAAGWLERLAGFLERQVAWQVQRLRSLGFPVLFVLDEPALSLVDRDAEPVILALRRVLDGARVEGAAVGVHCCAPLPSDALAELGLDFLSFDAHLPVADDGFSGLALDILNRGGSLAFGLAPTGPSPMTAESMETRWLELASSLGDPCEVAARSLITATCGLGLSTETEARISFDLARQTGVAIHSHASPARISWKAE